MSTKGLSAALVSHLMQGTATPVWFTQLDFVAAPLYVHSYIGTLNWNATDWLGVGDLGGIRQLEESPDLTMNAIQLVLSGVNQDIRDEVLSNDDYYMADVFIYLGGINASGALVATPDILWSGYLEDLGMSVGRADGDGVVATCANEVSRLKNARQIKFTDAHQQSRHSGDLIFEFMDQIPGLKLSWGTGGGDNLGGSDSGGSPAPGTRYPTESDDR